MVSKVMTHYCEEIRAIETTAMTAGDLIDPTFEIVEPLGGASRTGRAVTETMMPLELDEICACWNQTLCQPSFESLLPSVRQ